ncbi:MAG: hypothetical protein CL878_08665 [Dehalococcoidia bacterium]|nr:hypothetical protein [Dehalococcoidia bacterium]
MPPRTAAMAGRGLYVLLLRLLVPVGWQRPSRGHEPHDLPVGWYAYVGSARGPGGLQARLRHHLRPPTRPHWHIDYLRLTGASVVDTLTLPDGPGATRNWPRECDLATELGARTGGRRWPPRFGSSDCRCAGHLIHWREPPASLETLCLGSQGRLP